MRKQARIDRNQPAIVALFRKAGARVLSLAALGHGAPDLLIGAYGRLALVEVKDGSRPPSARRLTPDESRWHAAWAGFPVYIVECDADALHVLRKMQEDL